MKQQPHTKIKMIARNPLTLRTEEVFPEDECPLASMTPMFMGSDQKYYTVPGYTAEMAYAEWLEQQGS